MNKKHFGEMLGSLDEAVGIARGSRKPARAYTLSEPDVRAIRRSLGLKQVELTVRATREQARRWALVARWLKCRSVSAWLEEMADETSGRPAAVALGKLGGAKGGKARAADMTPEERRESARKAALARWKR